MRRSFVAIAIATGLSALLACEGRSQEYEDDSRSLGQRERYEDQWEDSDDDRSFRREQSGEQPYRSRSQSDLSRRSDSSSGESRSQSPETARQFIRQHDQNEDNHLSHRELPSHMRQNFDSLDQDGDGFLSQSELARHATQAMSRQTPTEVTYVWIIDAHSGRTNLKDLQQAYALLRQIDQDEDGYITRSELKERQQKVASYWTNHCFDCLDEDSDDQITRSEASGSLLGEQFDQVDEDGDSQVSRSELRTASRMRAEESDFGAASRDTRSEEEFESR